MKPRLHSQNQGFRWETPLGPFRRLTTDQARQWSEQGFFVLEDAIDRPTLERLISEIDPWEAKAEAWLRKQPQGRSSVARAGEITFTVHLVKRSAFLRSFCAGGLFRDLAWDLVGPDVRLYWDQAVYKMPSVAAPCAWSPKRAAAIAPSARMTPSASFRSGALDVRWPEIGDRRTRAQKEKRLPQEAPFDFETASCSVTAGRIADPAGLSRGVLVGVRISEKSEEHLFVSRFAPSDRLARIGVPGIVS